MDLAPEGARYSIYSENCIAERRKWLVVDGSELYLGAIQYASAFMEVVSIRDRYEYKLNFERGENVGGLAKGQSTASAAPESGDFNRGQVPESKVRCRRRRC